MLTRRSGSAWWILATLCLSVFTPRTSAQAQAAPLPEVAIERLEYAIGEWDIRSENLDVSGAVTGTTESGQIATWLVPGRIVQMRDRDSDGSGGGRSWWVYDARANAWTLVSIGVDDGSVWVLKGNLAEWRITSEPRDRPNGGQAMIRFTHYDIEPDSFWALMELSLDLGKTWTPRYRQHLTRRE